MFESFMFTGEIILPDNQQIVYSSMCLGRTEKEAKREALRMMEDKYPKCSYYLREIQQWA